MAEESGQSEQVPEEPAPRKKKAQEPLEVREQKLAPKPSLWPLGLAFTLVLTAIGLMVNNILFVCGIVLTIVAIAGWILEKQ